VTPLEAVDFVELVVAAWPSTRTEDKTADIWFAAGLCDIGWEDGSIAIRNLLKTKPFISLAEILTEVRRIRELRIAARPISGPPPELTDDERAYKATLDANIKRIADQAEIPRHALPRPGHGAAPTPEYDRQRGPYRSLHRVAAMRVRCPWDTCRAMPYEGCRTTSGRLLDHPHESRLVEAGLAEWVEVDGIMRAVLLGTENPEDPT
jgi:hypothetical protein